MASAVGIARTASPVGRLRDLIFPIGIITSVLVILVPLPTPVMDLLLAVNISWP